MDETSPAHDDEFSLLDLAVVIAESWKLLLIVPLLAGALVYFGLSMITAPLYTSQALVQTSSGEIALLQSARVLDGPMRESSWLTDYNGSLSQARAALLDAIDIRAVEDTGFYHVKLTHRSAESAQTILTLILQELVNQSKPTGSNRDALDLTLNIQQEGLAELSASLTRLNRFYDRTLAASETDTISVVAETGQSIVALVSNIEARRQEIATTTQMLDGTIQADDIIQPPTFPDSAEGRGLLMRVALAFVTVGFLMLITAFAREGFKRASHNVENLEKVNRIRRAFWLRQRPASSRYEDA